MGSKERILRHKEEKRCNILEAALDIAKSEGWNSLSMRKIADAIEYTAPIIYEYFSNKEAILKELTRIGYKKLIAKLEEAKAEHDTPEKQLEAMWLAYWNFALAETELYQLMFGVEMNCCECETLDIPESDIASEMYRDLIVEILDRNKQNYVSDDICKKYYTFWSVVHGLISINIVRRGAPDDLNEQILRDAITGIIGTMTTK